MIDLKQKKLLMLGGASYAPYVKEYADKAGFRLFSAGTPVNATMKACSEEFFLVNAGDVEGICALIKEQQIDGILSLGNENLICAAIEMARRCDLPFYLAPEHWEEMQDKENFKKHCGEFGVDVIEPLEISRDPSDEELAALPYPLVIKPAGSSGSKGITVCYAKDTVKEALKKAASFSRTGTYIAERFMQCPEFIVSYMIKDGEVGLWMLGDRHMNTRQKGFGALSNLSVFPSRFSELYINNVHDKMVAMLKKHGPKNGTLFVQGFVDGDKIRFFDPGLRFCGTLDTIVYPKICGISPLDWMVNHSLTGVLCTDEEFEKMDWRLHGKAYAQLSVLVHPGKIARIEGIDRLKDIPGVENVVQLLSEGSTGDMVGTLQQVLVRIHMIVENREMITETVKKIYDTVVVTDEEGKDMKMPYQEEYEI